MDFYDEWALKLKKALEERDLKTLSKLTTIAVRTPMFQMAIV
jgi:hypothetical protein